MEALNMAMKGTSPAFFFHLRLSLSPSDFLLYGQSHNLLASYLFGGKMKMYFNPLQMPLWATEKILIDGSFLVSQRKPYMPKFIFPSLLNTSNHEEHGKDASNTLPLHTNTTQVSVLAEEMASNEREKLSPTDSNVFSTDIDFINPDGSVPLQEQVLIYSSKSIVDQSNTTKEFALPEYEESKAWASTESVENAEESILKNVGVPKTIFPQVPALCWEAIIKAQLPYRVMRKLWEFLSDCNFSLAIVLLKVCSNIEKSSLVHAICHFANSFTALDSLTKALIHHEIEWVSHLPEKLLFQTSSLLAPYFRVLFSTEFLMERDVQWLQQITAPMLVCKHPESDGKDNEALSTSTAWRESRNSAEGDTKEVLEKAIATIVETVPAMLPSTLRALLYVVDDAVQEQLHTPRQVVTHPLRTHSFALSSGLPNQQRALTAAVGSCCHIVLATILGNYLLSSKTLKAKLLKQLLCQVASYSWEALPDDSTQKAFSFANQQRDYLHSKSEIPLQRLKEKDIPMEDYYLWNLAERVTKWMTLILCRPRLQSQLKFIRSPLISAGTAAARRIFGYLQELDQSIRNGTFMPAEEIDSNVLTNLHNFNEAIALAISQKA